MNKKLIYFFIFTIIIFSYIFNVDRLIRNQISTLNNSITNLYLNTIVITQESVNRYFNQITYIEQLLKLNEEYLQYKIKYNQLISSNDTIQNKDLLGQDIKLQKISILKYKKLNDFSKVILTKKEDDNKTINALITYDGYSAGIAMNIDNDFIGYLNNNDKCNYAVYIGNKKATGITSGITKDGMLKIKYVPLWQDVSIGDEVITSGMDDIFPLGVKIGIVKKIKSIENTKTVYLQPYIDPLLKNKFLLY